MPFAGLRGVLPPAAQSVAVPRPTLPPEPARGFWQQLAAGTDADAQEYRGQGRASRKLAGAETENYGVEFKLPIGGWVCGGMPSLAYFFEVNAFRT